jgi:FKBP12-rapamycin complex-associated protein
MVRDCAIIYLEDDNGVIRKAAAITASHLLVQDPVCYQSSTYSLQVVSDILERLLSLAIADQDASIRTVVLKSLDQRFDHHLAQAEHVRTLFLSLNDELFENRELAMSVIGRLSIYNPAYIMPSLRKLLIKLLAELEYSGVSKQREESAQLLGLLISSTPKLIQPYVESVLKVLLPKAKDVNAGVATKVLKAIGELAHVGCQDLTSYLPDLMSVIMDTLQDQSSPGKREAALRTLSQLASNTGWVIEPYLKYPDLLDALIGILKTEQLHAIRRETMKVMGVLGALDPYKHKIALRTEVTFSEPQDGMSNLLSAGPSSEEYYPAVAIRALMKVLRDTSLNIHHSAVITAVMYIFKTQGLKGVPFLHQIIPSLLSMMKSCPPSMLEFYFQQLGLLVTIVRQHIRNYIPDIITLIQEHWGLSSNIQTTALALIESIAIALEGEFKVYLPTLLPQMLLIFENDSTERQQPSQRLLNAFLIFGQNLEEYLHLVIPAVVKVIETGENATSLKKSAIQLLGQLCRIINIRDQAARIVHPLIRVLCSTLTELRNPTMEALARLAYQMRLGFLVFVPTIRKTMSKHLIQHAQYELVISKLISGEFMPQVFEDKDLGDGVDPQVEASAKKLPVNQNQLKKAWEVSQRSSKDDWQEWIRRFSVELLKESPTHALRACATLASAYPPLARELFNASFVSCWGELYDQFQDELVRSLEAAITSPTIPPEILQTLLNLAEFMEHDDKALPIDIKTLGLYATKCHAFAKALHYKELEFISEPLTNTIESLISINNQLQQPDSAIGILTYAQKNHDVELKETWYEKLQRWEDGLLAYEKKQQEDPQSLDATLGRMRCLHNLGEWDLLSNLAQERWKDASSEVQKAIAPLAAAGAWGTGDWDVMDEYIGMMKEESPDGAFFKAILSLHRNLYPQARQFIDKTRDLLDTELTATVGESYNRAYSIVVRIQMLGELEEIIQYKQMYDQPKAQTFIRNTWVTRIKGCQRNVDVWQRILRVRALVVSPKEDLEIWIKFSNLCRKGGRISLSYKTLSVLLDEPSADFSKLNFHTNPPRVIYACLKHAWIAGNRVAAFGQMREFTQTMVDKLGVRSINDIIAQVESAGGDHLKQNMLQLLARCHLKIGEWQGNLREDTQQKGILPETLRSYLAATHYDKNWYKAWHAWAFANFEVVSYHEKIQENIPTNVLIQHVVPSIQGFFRSISLSVGNSLQDTLRLLTLWFKYGFQQDVNSVIAEGFATVSIDTWLEVIPQLIARIHASSPLVRRLIHQLLSDVGKQHPQAIVYSLTVASKSQSASRKKAALAILDKMRSHSAELVEQALLVSQELIRVAILWHEMWHEGLEEASKLYFTDQNIEGMFATLEPLHQMLERVSCQLLIQGSRDFERSHFQSNIWARFGRCA